MSRPLNIHEKMIWNDLILRFLNCAQKGANLIFKITSDLALMNLLVDVLALGGLRDSKRMLGFQLKVVI